MLSPRPWRSNAEANARNLTTISAPRAHGTGWAAVHGRTARAVREGGPALTAGELSEARGGVFTASGIGLFHRGRVLSKHALSPVGVFFSLGANTRCPLSGYFFPGGNLALSPVGFYTGSFFHGHHFPWGFISRDPGRTLNVPRGLFGKNLFTIPPSPFRTISVICYSHPIHNLTVIYCAKLPPGHSMSGDSISSTNSHFPPPLTPPRRS